MLWIIAASALSFASGAAYFLIAVVVPGAILLTQGEKGTWSQGGTAWSLAAGGAGAIGALGIIMAFAFKGKPVYVMPLVFGCAPVVNTIFTMVVAKSYKQVNAIFLCGILLVAIGAVTVMTSKPKPPTKTADYQAKGVFGDKQVIIDENEQGVTVTINDLAAKEAKPVTYTATSLAALQEQSEEAHRYYSWSRNGTPFDVGMVILFVATTALCWGMYGPVLHLGQMRMEGSKLRPLICVGLAYFLIAVIIPSILLIQGEHGDWTPTGTIWSLAAGAAGAIGALGIILAFNSGGKPVLVMPLVFGGAPVVNTFTEIFTKGNFDQISLVFIAGLVMVAAGAVTVLIFAPRPAPKKAPPVEDAEPKPETVAT